VTDLLGDGAELVEPRRAERVDDQIPYGLDVVGAAAATFSLPDVVSTALVALASRPHA